MSRTILDIRPVEPKHRFVTIMGAYDALDAGSTLDLTVDHDPRCMYYTLTAMRPDTFRFTYLEDGPEVWRVEVTRLSERSPWSRTPAADGSGVSGNLPTRPAGNDAASSGEGPTDGRA